MVAGIGHHTMPVSQRAQWIVHKGGEQCPNRFFCFIISTTEKEPHNSDQCMH